MWCKEAGKEKGRAKHIVVHEAVCLSACLYVCMCMGKTRQCSSSCLACVCVCVCVCVCWGLADRQIRHLHDAAHTHAIVDSLVRSFIGVTALGGVALPASIKASELESRLALRAAGTRVRACPFVWKFRIICVGMLFSGNGVNFLDNAWLVFVGIVGIVYFFGRFFL